MNKDIIIVLDNIRSVFNVGSIFRTADGAGVKKIILTGITPTPEHQKLKKTALGAENFVEWEYYQDVQKYLSKSIENGYKIYSIEQCKSSIDYRDAELDNKSIIVFGNEITGVNPEILEISDKILEIPMRGKKNSLNVATTVGIILYNFFND